MAFICTAQKMQPYPSSDSIVITGLVKEPVKFSLTNLGQIPDTVFSILRVLNHHGEFKTNYRNVKAVALNKILESSITNTIKPKDMYGYFFVLKAMDGYAVVYSYNELFSNTPGIFIVTAYDDYNLGNMPEKPMILSLCAAPPVKLV